LLGALLCTGYGGGGGRVEIWSRWGWTGAEVGRVAESSGGFEVKVGWGEAGVGFGTVGTAGAGSSTAGVVSGIVSKTAS
jgi:hypothetical protein